MFMPIPSPEAILGVIVPLLFFDIVVVILRFYSRGKRQQPFLADDWLMLPALVLTIGLAFCIFYGIGRRSLGYHAPPEFSGMAGLFASDKRIRVSRMLEYSFLSIFAPANALIKLSVLCLYRRIFVIQKENWKDPRNIFFCASIAIVFIWGISYTFAFIFMCKGDTILFISIPESAEICNDTFMIGYSCVISDFIMDALIILIPIPFVCKLRLSFDKKMGVLFVFMLGIVSAVASLIRLMWMVWANNMGIDPSYDEALMYTSELWWCMLEVAIGLIAACLPTLRGLVKTNSCDNVFKNVRSYFSSGSASTSKLSYSKDSREKSTGSLDGSFISTEPALQTSTTQERRVAPWV
ncbi:hypothetical protein EJ04DRAFT_556908 [Polyplosphaeria fusca]|uniref:Rhodopsin domain-containing protein n=1 Tax=Polyplosphaeria fusca TaxID=682080 RepID=A0A9P4QJ26_9PLEO|nr:hypothetical protein EJ04DRAFT_556908 [Polyplosphaeria fusca]